MKKRLFALSLLGFIQTAWSAPPTDDSLEILFEVTKLESVIHSQTVNVEQQLRQSLRQTGQKLSDAREREIEKMSENAAQIIREEMAWPKLKPMIASIYRDVLDQQEVDAFIAFYRSPAGQSYASKMPIIAQHTRTLIDQVSEHMVPKIRAAISDAKSTAR